MKRELYFTVHKNELGSVAFLQLARHPDGLHFTTIWGCSIFRERKATVYYTLFIEFAFGCF